MSKVCQALAKRSPRDQYLCVHMRFKDRCTGGIKKAREPDVAVTTMSQHAFCKNESLTFSKSWQIVLVGQEHSPFPQTSHRPPCGGWFPRPVSLSLWPVWGRCKCVFRKCYIYRSRNPPFLRLRQLTSRVPWRRSHGRELAGSELH